MIYGEEMLEELNSIQLYKILKHDKCTRGIFLGVFARDQLPFKPKYPSCFIINTDDSSKQGKHWLAFYYDSNGDAMFFDSFGMHPVFYKLTSYLNRTSRNWSFNSIQYQSFNTKTCGYFAFIFLLLKCRGIDINDKNIKEIDLNIFD
jgi:hypothetical protein